MKVEVVTPEENMGDVIGDLNKRRALIEGTGERAGKTIVNAAVPLSEMFGYVTDLRTLTSGRATSSMLFGKLDKRCQHCPTTVSTSRGFFTVTELMFQIL